MNTRLKTATSRRACARPMMVTGTLVLVGLILSSFVIRTNAYASAPAASSSGAALLWKKWATPTPTKPALSTANPPTATNTPKATAAATSLPTATSAPTSAPASPTATSTTYLPLVTQTPTPTPVPPTPTPTSTRVPPTATPTATAVPPTPTVSATPGSGGWNNIRSWVYQLGNYKNNTLTQIANNRFDAAVVDLARDGSSDYFTAAEVGAVKASGKFALAYFEIGAIENYRPEWSSIPSDLLLGQVSGWPGEYYVKYWDSRWWPVVQGRIDQAINAGFDGAYLDMIVTYEEIPANSAGTDRTDLASKMVDLIAHVATYAHSRNPNFKVLPQNSPELRTWPKYLPAIDGIGMENMYYNDTGAPCTASWCQDNRNNAAAIAAAGKVVLSIDYTTTAAEITNAYNQSRAAGFVPYVSTINLDTCYLSGVTPLTPCQ